MILKNTTKVVLLLGTAFLFAGCSQPMVISNVDYSQPIETVLEPGDDGMVHDLEHGLRFNVKPLQYAETQDTSSVSIEEIRMIRGNQGYYYITAPGFKNVYVMSPDKNKLRLVKKLAVNPEGIAKPAFNQRDTHIQLLNRSTMETYIVTGQEIKQSDKNEKSVAKKEARLQ